MGILLIAVCILGSACADKTCTDAAAHAFLERYLTRNLIDGSDCRSSLEHRNRTAGADQIGLVCRDLLLERQRHKTGSACGAVIGAEDCSCACCGVFLLQNDGILIPESADNDRIAAEILRKRKHRRCTDAAADQDCMCGLIGQRKAVTERREHIDRIACAQLRERLRTLAAHLKYDAERTLFLIDLTY